MSKFTYNYNYVYLITDLINDMFYIGAKSCNEHPSENLGIKYFSSSQNKNFIQDQKNNPENYKYEILSIHENRLNANKEEARLHELYDVRNNKKFYNKINAANSNIGFNTSNLVVAVNENTNKIEYVSKEEFYNSPHLHGNAKGYIPVKDEFGNTKHIKKDDPDYISGKYIHTSSNRVIVLDENNNPKSVLKSDPDYISGKYKSHFKGLVNVYDKNGNKLRVSINDPEYINGNLTPIVKGYILCKDLNGNNLYIHKNDERFKTGELVGINKNKICITNGSKNKMIEKTDIIPENWYHGRCKVNK